MPLSAPEKQQESATTSGFEMQAATPNYLRLVPLTLAPDGFIRYQLRTCEGEKQIGRLSLNGTGSIVNNRWLTVPMSTR